MSSTRAVRLGNATVPLTAKPGSKVDLDLVEQFGPFKDWVAALGKEMTESPVASRVAIRGIEVTDVDEFGSGKVGFVKFRADVNWSDEAGGRIPGVVFSRGGSVALLVLVKPKDDGKAEEEERVVLVVQPRIPIAVLEFTELPAGMLDGDNKFAGTAARELQEECGIEISEDELTDLTELAFGSNPKSDLRSSGVYSSPGGSDEFIRLFLCRKTLPLEDIKRLEGKQAGLRGDGERIEVKLVKLKDLWRATRDMKALSALALYQQCAAAGLLPKS
ncbi:hypothetical protein PhCBS80983_g00128 [Powellomyces hirtus]|uniref:Nudix hydrolase domain-containing protein n=1 Tax=Powellomyces hirtus TaxID=109895 RepID=A0A507EHU1_9FUNG|nr:hypothetical protein PhCBS80983_g00128 [Powellomyces hirtus]